jgi:hypothetical protein
MTDETISDRLASIMTWLREPDCIEVASLEWLKDWMDRRPIAELAMVAMLMPDPASSSFDRNSHPSLTVEDVYANCKTTLIGFRDELTERNIEFICDQISRKVMLALASVSSTNPRGGEK